MARPEKGEQSGDSGEVGGRAVARPEKGGVGPSGSKWAELLRRMLAPAWRGKEWTSCVWKMQLCMEKNDGSGVLDG